MTDQARTPNPDLKALDRLVGTWGVSGGAEGTVTYEWMEGGFFLIQRFDLMHEGHEIEGVEIIGHLQPFGEEPNADMNSRAYDNVGNTLDYVYEIEGDTLIIWAGAKGSPAYFKGKFSDDGDTSTGAWPGLAEHPLLVDRQAVLLHSEETRAAGGAPQAPQTTCTLDYKVGSQTFSYNREGLP